MKAVYSLASQPNHWNNTQLLKECGLIPFMLHKNFGYKAVMVGEKINDYPYLSHLSGLEMVFVPSSGNNVNTLVKNQINYINENYQKMDALIVRGLYYSTCHILQAYKRKRRDGKVYLYLDANSWWMDTIPWSDPFILNSLNDCDLISTSSCKMTEVLNKKWPYSIVEHIPNGFFNASGKQIKNEGISKKENIILTVGRIGTEQKANNILVQAFALVFKKLPGWKLRLAGPAQDGFKKKSEEFIKSVPGLENRIEFLGNITDKEELYKEYSKAKIFALTSTNEGGAPNVVAEALFHGCFTVTSEVDAARDITDNGNCGRSFPLWDYKALAKIFLEVCANKELLQQAPQKSIKFAQSHYDWDLIINRINHLLFEGK